MIEEAKEDNPNSVLTPLIRLKIEFTGFELVRTNFLVSRYTNKIANLKDVIQFYKKKENSSQRELVTDDMENEFKNKHKDNDSCVGDELAWQDDMLKDFIDEAVIKFF